jgi:X-X-X-Leu-X-X-Gly heptad repeat protein
MGVAMPGLKESLSIGGGLNIPESVVIKAHTDSFRIDGTYSLATTGVLAESGIEDATAQADAMMGELESGLSQLSSAANKLTSGSSALANGISQLAAGTNELKVKAPTFGDAIRQIADGATTLYKGSKQIHEGTGELSNGAQRLDTEAGNIEAGALVIKGGTEELYEGATLLSGGATELREGAENLRTGTREYAEGTKEFSQMVPGQTLDVIGPLGNGFTMKDKKAILFGGGIGIPPMLELAKQLNCDSTAVLGYRDEIFLADEFEKVTKVAIARSNIPPVINTVVFEFNLFCFLFSLLIKTSKFYLLFKVFPFYENLYNFI